MNENQAIEIVQSQFEEAKKIQVILQEQQTNEDYNHANVGIHAMGIVLELAKKQVEEMENN